MTLWVSQETKISRHYPRSVSRTAMLQEIGASPLRLEVDRVQWDADRGNNTTDQIDETCRQLRLWGLVEQNRRDHGDYMTIQFKRPRFYREVEQERERLGVWGRAPGAPRYSVCVCNYNMSDTLDRAMSSVAGQLDPKLYEVLVIDDGSSDDSLQVLQQLAARFPHFRYIPLPRDA
jgi:Glycosyl transferase family 2